MDQLLTPEQVAERLQVQAKTVRAWLNSKALKGVKLGRLWRVKEADLSAFLDQGQPKRSVRSTRKGRGK